MFGWNAPKSTAQRPLRERPQEEFSQEEIVIRAQQLFAL